MAKKKPMMPKFPGKPSGFMPKSEKSEMAEKVKPMKGKGMGKGGKKGVC